MGLADITESAVRKAMTEFERIGRDRFLKKYRIGPAKKKFIIVADRRYDLSMGHELSANVGFQFSLGGGGSVCIGVQI